MLINVGVVSCKLSVVLKIKELVSEEPHDLSRELVNLHDRLVMKRGLSPCLSCFTLFPMCKTESPTVQSMECYELSFDLKKNTNRNEP